MSVFSWCLFASALILAVLTIVQRILLAKKAKALLGLVASLPVKAPETEVKLDRLLADLGNISPPFSKAAKSLRLQVKIADNKTFLVRSPSYLFHYELWSKTAFLPQAIGQSMLVLALGCAAIVVGVSEPAQANLEAFVPLFAAVLILVGIVHGVSNWQQKLGVLSLAGLTRWMDDVLVSGGSTSIARLQRDNNRALRSLIQKLSDMQEGQKSAQKEAEKSHIAMQKFGKQIKGAFASTIQAELAPTMSKMAELADRTNRSTQQFMENASQTQVRGLERMISSVSQGIDQVVGANLRETTESFSISIQQQEQSLSRWRQTVEKVASLVDSMQTTTQTLAAGTEKMAQAAEPVEAAAEVFSMAARRLQDTLPSLEGVGERYEQAQTVLEQAHLSLRDGTEHYLQAGAQVTSMISELRELHGLTIKRIADGVDEAVLGSMKEAGNLLVDVSSSQAESLKQWRDTSAMINSTMNNLEKATVQVAGFADEIRAASAPTVQSSQRFLQASEILENTVPTLASAVGVHEESRKLLEEASRTLRSGIDEYGQAALLLKEMIANMKLNHEHAIQQVSDGVELNINQPLREVGTELQNRMETSYQNLNQVLEQSTSQTSASLQKAADLLLQTLQQAGEQLDGTVKTVAVHLQDTVGQSTSTMNESLDKSRGLLTSTLDTYNQELVKSITKVSQGLESVMDESSKTMKTSLVNAAQGLGTMMNESTKNMETTLLKATQGLGTMMDESTKHMETTLGQATQGLGTMMDESSKTMETTLSKASHGFEASMGDSSRYMETTLAKAGEGLVLTMEQSSQNMEATLSKVSRGLENTMGESRKYMEETLSKATDYLEGSLQSAGAELTREWKETGKTIQEVMTEASQTLGQTVHSTGRVFSQKLEDVSMNLEEAARKFSASLRIGADDLRFQLQDVGSSWEESVVSAAESLSKGGEDIRSSMSEAGQSMIESAKMSGTQIEQGAERAKAQLSSLGTTWQESIQGSAKAIQSGGEEASQSLSYASENLRKTADEVGVLLNKHLANVGQAWSDGASDAQASLHELTLGLVTSAAQAGKSLEGHAESAGQSLDNSASAAASLLSTAFKGADVQVRESLSNISAQMESSLESAHLKLSSTLEGASGDLKQLSEAQAEHIVQWTEIVTTLRPALSDLKSSAVDLGDLVADLQKVVGPTAAAGQDFRVAAEKISGVFPNIDATAVSYQQFSGALNQTADNLSQCAQEYSTAGEDMTNLIQNIQKSLKLQLHCNQEFNTTLQHAAESVKSLEPVSLHMQAAAGDVLEISQKTASAVSVIRQASNAQDASLQEMREIGDSLFKNLKQQSQQLQSFSKEMSKLQVVLTSGVDAFAERLPHSVDQTLLQFDAALGVGVARLGSAVERLREAMDDLLERMESVFDGKRRR